MKFLFSLLLFVITSFPLQAHLKVVIVGAGPCGLAAAIEAKRHGADITLVEKRSQYTREQYVVLWEHSIQLLQGWGVDGIQLLEGPEFRIGFMALRELEESLAKRVHELGIPTIQGEFNGFQEGEQAVVYTVGSEEKSLPYDVLIGADGAHSHVREQAGIALDFKGHACGAAIVLPSTAEEFALENAAIDGFFMRKIAIPSFRTFVFMQGPKILAPEQFKELMRVAGWEKEASLKDQDLFFGHIDVILQQACTFSNPGKATLLVGDAAATASFFEGGGCNFGFKEAVLAGHCVADLSEGKEEAYRCFNEEMKKTTDGLIEESQYLFTPLSVPQLSKEKP